MNNLKRWIPGLLILSVCLAAAFTSNAGPEGIHTCGGLPYTCEELVQLGYTYPFPREPGSFLFVNGVAFPFAKVTNRLLHDSVVRLPDASTMRVDDLLTTFGLEAAEDRSLIPVIGYGSLEIFLY